MRLREGREEAMRALLLVNAAHQVLQWLVFDEQKRRWLMPVRLEWKKWKNQGDKMRNNRQLLQHLHHVLNVHAHHSEHCNQWHHARQNCALFLCY